MLPIWIVLAISPVYLDLLLQFLIRKCLVDNPHCIQVDADQNLSKEIHVGIIAPQTGRFSAQTFEISRQFSRAIPTDLPSWQVEESLT